MKFSKNNFNKKKIIISTVIFGNSYETEPILIEDNEAKFENDFFEM